MSSGFACRASRAQNNHSGLNIENASLRGPLGSAYSVALHQTTASYSHIGVCKQYGVGTYNGVCESVFCTTAFIFSYLLSAILSKWPT